MGRRGAYLYKRTGSDNYWLRLVYPDELVALVGRKRLERSLRTANKVEAEAAASEEIRKHKLALLAAQRARAGKSQPMGLHKRFPPNSTHYENGLTIVAMENDLLFLDQDNRQVRIEPNAIELDLTNTIEFALRDTTRIWLSATTAAEAHRYSKRDNDEDIGILKRWLDKNRIKPHIKADACNVFAQFRKQIAKPLRLCRHRDAILFMDYLSSLGLADKTVAKKISYLSAACNIAIKEDVLTRNVFSGIAPRVRKNWQTARLCLSDEQMAIARSHLDELRAEDQLLWKLLATTGMRLSEPFEATFETTENGLRYIMVGTKTEASRRRVPLPDDLLLILPERITKCMFSDSPETHGKRLRYFLRKHGISYNPLSETGDRRLTLHSLRHRAATKLRACECPEDIREQLLGHEYITIANSYGKGFPVETLKKWQSQIGY